MSSKLRVCLSVCAHHSPRMLAASPGTKSGVQNREPPWSSWSAGDGIHSRLDRPLNWLLHFSIITIICGYYKQRLLLLEPHRRRWRTLQTPFIGTGVHAKTAQKWDVLAFKQFATAPHGGREGGTCLFYLLFCLWRLNTN